MKKLREQKALILDEVEKLLSTAETRDVYKRQH